MAQWSNVWERIINLLLIAGVRKLKVSCTEFYIGGKEFHRAVLNWLWLYICGSLCILRNSSEKVFIFSLNFQFRII